MEEELKEVQLSLDDIEELNQIEEKTHNKQKKIR